MSKFDHILSSYANMLRGKSLKELKNHFKMLGGSLFNGKKEDYIHKIVNLTQNNETELKNVIKIIQNQNSPMQKITTQIKPLLMRQLNRQKLKQIAELQETKKQQYTKISGNKRLISLLKEQLTPGRQFFSKKRILNEQKDKKKMVLVKKSKDNQLQKSKDKKNQLRQGRQLMKLINDYKLQKTQQQRLKQKQQQNKIDLLHSLNLQTQIILPKHEIKENYQHTEQQIKVLLQNQDPNSFSRYIKQKMPRQFRRLRTKQKKTGVIRLLSQAVNVMRILKQVNYNKFDILNLFIGDVEQSQQIQIEQIKKNSNKRKIIIQFIKQENKYRKYYSEYLQNYSLHIKINISRKILNFIKNQISYTFDQGQQQSYIQTTLNLFQFSFYFQANLLRNLQQKNNSQIEIQQKIVKITKQIIRQTIIWWIKYSKMMKINSLDKLGDLLRVLVNFNNYINYIDNFVIFTLDPIEYGNYYENISKEINLCFTDLFYPDILSPDFINQLLINFEKVLGQDQLPNQVLKSIANMANMVNKQLKSQTKKSIIKLFGVRSVFKDDNIICSLIRHAVEKPILYGLKQSLLGIELAIKYQLDNKEIIIQNIILFNIDPNQLNSQLKQYLYKLVKENISEENQRQIIQYLK